MQAVPAQEIEGHCEMIREISTCARPTVHCITATHRDTRISDRAHINRDAGSPKAVPQLLLPSQLHCEATLRRVDNTVFTACGLSPTQTEKKKRVQPPSEVARGGNPPHRPACFSCTCKIFPSSHLLLNKRTRRHHCGWAGKRKSERVKHFCSRVGDVARLRLR